MQACADVTVQRVRTGIVERATTRWRSDRRTWSRTAPWSRSTGSPPTGDLLSGEHRHHGMNL
jgi:hypothetical protein